MDNDFTQISISEFTSLVRKAVKKEKVCQPKKQTILLLKDFARNYRGSAFLPDGVQGYMLS